MEENIKLFGRLNIKETYGISWIEFINLPRDVCEMLVTNAATLMKEKNRNIEDQLKELE